MRVPANGDPPKPKKASWNAGMHFLVMIYNRLSESCIKTCLQNNLDGVHGTYILGIFFLKKGVPLNKGPETIVGMSLYSGNKVHVFGGP